MQASVWQRGLPELPCFPALRGDLRCEAAVIGAGMTGLLTAFLLREKGVNAVVLEGCLPGSGATASATAELTVQQGRFCAPLVERLGLPLACRYARRQQEAVEDYETLVNQLSIDCSFHRAPLYLYARRNAAQLQQELSAARLIGLPVDWEREPNLPFSVAGALRFEAQAYFNPMRFLYALVPHLHIFAHTRARRIQGGVIYTDHGRVRADHIVVTSYLRRLCLPDQDMRRPHGEPACALAVEGISPLKGIYRDVDASGLSLRPFENGILLAGKRHKLNPLPLPERCMHLESLAKHFWPDCRITACWASTPAFPIGDFPVVRAYVGRRADLYLAPGFSARGMVPAMVAARFISDRIAENR